MRRSRAAAPRSDYPTPAPSPSSSTVEFDDEPVTTFEAPTLEADETVEDYLQRNAALAARTMVRESAYDRRAAQWMLEHTTRDRLSAPIDVSPEQLASSEGVADVMRLLGARALRGEAGLTESLKACQVVREVADSMFAQEIASLREAVDKAKMGRLAPVIAHQIEDATGGVVPVEKYRDVIESAPAAPTWGRFGRAGALIEDVEG